MLFWCHHHRVLLCRFALRIHIQFILEMLVKEVLLSRYHGLEVQVVILVLFFFVHSFHENTSPLILQSNF